MSDVKADSGGVRPPGDHTRDLMLEAEASAGAGTCMSAGRNLAAAQWLSLATPSVRQAVAEWQDRGAAWLRPGALFTAVIVRASLLHEAVGSLSPQECGPVLHTELDGPVFYREQEFGPEAGYTVLLPGSASRMWRVPGTVVFSPAALLLVPAPDRREPTADCPWWVVPPDGTGTLCTPGLLASLLARTTACGPEGGGHA